MQLREILSINTYKGKMVQKPKLKAILKLNLIMIKMKIETLERAIKKYSRIQK